MKKFSQHMKMVGVITLFFFSWSYLPLFQFVAYAATQKKQATKPQLQNAGKQQPAAKLEKLLDGLRENTSKAEEKTAKDADISSEVEAIKARRADLNAIDADLKKEFASTEQKIKAANLPKEILDRHYKFVKSYETNLGELKASIEAIEKAKTPSVLTSEIAKTKRQLAKVRPPKRKPFDPSKLPNSIVKAKERQPKLKNDEWEQELKKGRKKPKTAHVYNSRQILVASNGPLTGLLSGSTAPEGNLQLANQTLDSIIQNASVGVYSGPYRAQPTAEDMLETPETHITDAIRAKAAELKNKPVSMFNWLWNNMYFVPTYGSIQGADMCLQTTQCNATDIASLTVALFRAAGFPARYEFATKEIEINRFLEMMGGFTDPVAAINFAASGGIPVTGIRSGGKITAVQFEHVYASAWIPYGNYRGTMNDNTIPTWVPLDFTIKHYVETPGIDLNTAVPFDAQSFVNQIQSTATINEAEGYVTNVNSALIQQTIQDYQARAQDYISQNTPSATVGDIIGSRIIKQEKFPFLPITTWAKDITNPAGAQSHTLPDSMLHKVSLVLQDSDTSETTLSYTVNLAEVAGKKVTVSYDPATAADQTTINNYVEQSATSIPAYLIQFKPVLKIEGITVATGAPVGMGHAQDLTVSIISPNGTQIMDHDLLAGDYTAIGINPSTINLDVLNNRINKNDFSEPVGEMLHQTALSYWAEADAFNSIIAKTLRVNNLRHPSELAASAKVSVSYIWGVPSSATYNRRNIDVKLDNQSLASKTADKSNEFSYMQRSGITSSFLEGAIFDQLYLKSVGDSISAVTALRAANDQGIPIYKIDSSNVSVTIPKLQVAAAVKTEIANAVNAGLSVQIPQTNIVQNGWTGVGYIISNPLDGSGAYRISGGLNGSDSGTGVATVIALPQIPATWSMAFLTNGLLTETGTGIQMAAGTSVMEGIAVGGGAAGAAAALAEIAAIILIAVLIYTIAKAILDKMLPRYEIFRHYTTFAAKTSILNRNLLFVSPGGAIGPGAYVTKTVWLDPADPANVVQIQIRLGMPSDKIQTYIDLRVNLNKVIVTYGVPFGFPDQCTLNMPTWGLSPIPLDGDTATPLP